MKLLLLTYDFAPIIGGKSTILKNIFERTSFEKTIITINAQNSDKYDKNQSFKIVRVPKIFFNIPMPIFRVYFFKIALLFLVSIYYFLKEKPDHIIAGQLLSDGVAAYYLYRFFGAKYSLFVYDTIDGEAPFFGRDKKIAQKVLINAKKIFYISKFMKKKLLRHGTKEETLVLVYPTADPNIFVPGIDTSGLRKKLGIKGKVILTVARVVERKGIDRIIMAMPNLLKKVKGVTYVVIGKGPKIAEFKGLAEKLGVHQNIIFRGFVPEKDLLLYYNLCDVFAMPSSYIKEKFISEGFGIVFLEANACEKPVVGVALAGMSDAIVHGKTGLLLKNTSQRELEKTLLKLLLDAKLAKKLGREGRKRIEKEVNWQTLVKKFDSALAEVKTA